MANTGMTRVPSTKLQLTNPRSLAVYDSYEDAQRAVDYLSDHGFAVQNVLICGTDLRQIERVTGRMSIWKALGGGLLSGMWLGLMVGLLMSFFVEGATWMTIASAVVAGAFFFTVWAAIGYTFTQGKRDFTSVSQVVATRYEILVEHATFEEANRILRGPSGASSPRPDEQNRLHQEPPEARGADDVDGGHTRRPDEPGSDTRRPDELENDTRRPDEVGNDTRRPDEVGNEGPDRDRAGEEPRSPWAGPR